MSNWPHSWSYLAEYEALTIQREWDPPPDVVISMQPTLNGSKSFKSLHLIPVSESWFWVDSEKSPSYKNSSSTFRKNRNQLRKCVDTKTGEVFAMKIIEKATSLGPFLAYQHQWIGLWEKFKRNTPWSSMGKSMVSGFDFPAKTNPLTTATACCFQCGWIEKNKNHPQNNYDINTWDQNQNRRHIVRFMAFYVAFYGIGLPLIICLVKHRNGMMITIHELFFLFGCGIQSPGGAHNY